MTGKKGKIPELAIFGGQPMFLQPLCVNRPNIGSKKDYFKRLDKMFENRLFTNDGPYVQELEQKIASFLNVKYCILTCNGTMALQLICKALNLAGEVILPSFTFIATAHALKWQGLKPVFCDIDANTHNIDPEACVQLINNKTSAILGVHLWGRGCHVDELQNLAHENDLKLFFDAAHSFGSCYKGNLIGGFGDAEAFSFHATKAFNTFEGGAVTTNNDEVASRIRNLRNFGFIDYDCVDGLGINAKMPEVCAAMGLTNLDQFKATIQKNKFIFDCYIRLINKIKGLTVLEYHEKSNYQYVVVEVNEHELDLNRNELLSVLHAENVLVRRYFYPGCHLMEPYVSKSNSSHYQLHETEKLAEKILVFPSGFDVTLTAIEKIIQIIEKAVKYAKEIKALQAKRL